MKELFTKIQKIDPRLLLIGFGIVVYIQTIFNGFVMDDQGLIINNKSVHSISNLFNFFRGSIFDYGGSLGGIYYRPMMTTYFSIIYTFFGGFPFYYHVTQLVLHITNSVLTFGLFQRFTKKWSAFFLALIFLIHPIQVETVSYIAAVQDVLFVFFGLIFLRKVIRNDSDDYKIYIPYIYLLLSFFSKETGFLFMLLGLLYVFIVKKKLFLKHLISSISVLIFYIFMRVVVAKITIHATDEFPMMRMNLFERALSIPEIVFYYLKTFFVPFNLVSVQSWVVSSISFEKFILPVVVIFIFFGGILFLSKKAFGKKEARIALLFFWIWMVFGFSLHIQLVPLDLTVSDRWFYFTIVGLLGVLGVLYDQFAIEILLGKRNLFSVFLVCLFIIFIYLSVRSFIRVGDWRDTKVLALHDLKIQKDNYQLLSALGAMYLEEKRYSLAAKYSEESVKIFPHWGTSYYNLGVAYHMDHKIKPAEIAYKRSIENAKVNINAYENLAILYIYNYPPVVARDYAKKNLKKFPGSVKLWHVLALAEHRLGNDAASTDAARMIQLLSQPSGPSL